MAETSTALPQTEDLSAILNATGTDGWITRRWPLLAGSLIALALLVGAYAWVRMQRAAIPTYRTEAVQRGELVVTVAATGNVKPTNEVDVGSELSGIIERVLVEENEPIRRNQVLAQLDTSKLQDVIAKSKGALAQALAQVQQAAATVKEKQVAHARLEGMKAISHGGIPSQADLDSAKAELERAIASRAVAQASVEQANAQLRSDETNLLKASIRSPIDGVVLTRAVEPGQTVAASLQTPVLFKLAENLAQMQLEVDVDEADVGQVREGQAATFTVDAYPARRYPARIRRVDLGSQVKEQVVSYRTVLAVDNSDLSLRPGMTATAEITTQHLTEALLVPAGALRFAPAPTTTATTSGGLTGMLVPHMPPSSAKSAASGQQVWNVRDGKPVAVAVRTGASDGRYTQILEGDLQPGQAVIVESAGAERR